VRREFRRASRAPGVVLICNPHPLAECKSRLTLPEPPTGPPNTQRQRPIACGICKKDEAVGLPHSQMDNPPLGKSACLRHGLSGKASSQTIGSACLQKVGPRLPTNMQYVDLRQAQKAATCRQRFWVIDDAFVQASSKQRACSPLTKQDSGAKVCSRHSQCKGK